MYTEIAKIIEGGLNGDREKVYNYAKLLADNLEETGDKALAKKIRNVISGRKSGVVALDSLSSKPVDSESRMDNSVATIHSYAAHKTLPKEDLT